MHIVFLSRLYKPVVGGSVVVLERWASEAIKQGNLVTIGTKTLGEGCKNWEEWRVDKKSIRICRFRKIFDYWKVLLTADAVVIIEMSLFWVLISWLAGRRPLVTHHTMYMNYGDSVPFYRKVQKWLGYVCYSAACSQMIASEWGECVRVLANPYENEKFRNFNTVRDIDFLFVGRLIWEKGANVFIEGCLSYLEWCKKEGKDIPVFAIAGKGGEELSLRRQAGKDENAFLWLGEVEMDEMPRLYNRAKCLIIPSVWTEPFGLISLEAMACGCEIIASDQPGLRESTGGMARYFSTGNAADLVDQMKQLDTKLDCRHSKEKKAFFLQKYTSESSFAEMLRMVGKRK